MKLFSISIGLLLAAIGIFFVPVSFSVDGFGLVVNSGGVRTLRASEAGQVLHFPSENGQFSTGQIVTAVVFADAVAKNTLLEGTLRRELAKIETDYLDVHSKLFLDVERDGAVLTATAERLAAREILTLDTNETLVALQAFTIDSQADINELNEDRLEQLLRLEKLVELSDEASAMPTQTLATMLESIQSNRLSVISSQRTRFSSDKVIHDMIKELNDLNYSNSVDRAEVDILSNRLVNLEQQMRELDELRLAQRAESAALFLAKSVLPQIAMADGMSVDMRTLQASRADVARSDPLRLLATRDSAAGLSLLIFGTPEVGEIVLQHGAQEIILQLPVDVDQITSALVASGLNVAKVHVDQQTVGSIDVFSVFVELDSDPENQLIVLQANARDAQEVPIPINTSIILAAESATQSESTTNEIVGFLENRYVVILQPGQPVRGSISDASIGTDIVFEAHLLDRDYSTVDTQELGIRLGNRSLADKIIKRGVLSQVVVGIDRDSAFQIEHFTGAVVHLSFPLARQSLFSFLLARDASI